MLSPNTTFKGDFQPLSQSAANNNAGHNAQLSSPIETQPPHALHGCDVFCSSATCFDLAVAASAACS